MFTTLALVALTAQSAQATPKPVRMTQMSGARTGDTVTLSLTGSNKLAGTTVRGRHTGKVTVVSVKGAKLAKKHSVRLGDRKAIAYNTKAGFEVALPSRGTPSCTGPIKHDIVGNLLSLSMTCPTAQSAGVAPAAAVKTAATSAHPTSIAAPAKPAAPGTPKGTPAAAPVLSPAAAATVAAASGGRPGNRGVDWGRLTGAALLLAALGAGVFWLRKKKMTTPDGMINIRQRVPLGPKRELLVTEMGGQTLILASSEAGLHVITRLKSAAPSARELEDAMASAFERDLQTAALEQTYEPAPAALAAAAARSAMEPAPRSQPEAAPRKTVRRPAAVQFEEALQTEAAQDTKWHMEQPEEVQDTAPAMPSLSAALDTARAAADALDKLSAPAPVMAASSEGPARTPAPQEHTEAVPPRAEPAPEAATEAERIGQFMQKKRAAGAQILAFDRPRAGAPHPFADEDEGEALARKLAGRG